MQVHIRWVEDGRFHAASERGAEMVLATKNSGVSAPTPTEALLMAVGGCTAIDVVHILQRMRVQVRGLEVTVRGQLREQVPRYFERIQLHYRVHVPKNCPDEWVERAIRLSQEKYCSVRHTVDGKAKVEFTYEVIRDEV